MRSILCFMIVIALLCDVRDSNAQSPRYRLVRLPTLPDQSPRTTALDINNDGVICGATRTSGKVRSIIWDSQNGIRILDDLVSGLGSNATAINVSGAVAGISGFYDGPVYTSQGYIWTSSSGTIGIGDLPGGIFYSTANGLNNLGHVVGYSWSSHSGSQAPEAFLWTPEVGMTGLGNLFGAGDYTSIAFDINDSGWITGESTSPMGIEAFLWTAETGMVGLGDVSGGLWANSTGNAINNLGQIAGQGTLPNGHGQAMLWTPGEGMIGLGVLPGDEFSWAEDLNEHEQVVGASVPPDGGGFPKGFIWKRGRGMRSLADLVDPCIPAQQRLIWGGLAINDHGQIAATDGGNGILLDPYLPGDLNNDGAVTLQDLATQLSNFGRVNGVGYDEGDVQGCDGDVDLQDLAVLLENFGALLD